MPGERSLEPSKCSTVSFGWSTDLTFLPSGVLVPGGFGSRGIEGMVLAAKWAREQNKPFLGICLGFQIAVIEWARSICGLTGTTRQSCGMKCHSEHICVLPGANSEELNPETADKVVVFMPEISKTHLGGTMRLGLRASIFSPGTEQSKIRQLYGGEEIIWERHRHRYEVGPNYVERLEKSGMKFIGRDEKGERMQVMELPGTLVQHLIRLLKLMIGKLQSWTWSLA